MASSRELQELDDAELRLKQRLEEQLKEIEEKRRAVQEERVKGLGNLLVRANVLKLDDTLLCGGLLEVADQARRAEAGDPDAAKIVEAWKRSGARFLPEQKAKRPRSEGAGKAPSARKKTGTAATAPKPGDVATQPAEGAGVGAGPAGTDPDVDQSRGPGDRREPA